MKVFVSHVKYDTWIAQQMACCIREAGAETFIDRYDIEVGDAFEAELRTALSECDELVALLTPYSVRRAWLQHEMGVVWAWAGASPVCYTACACSTWMHQGQEVPDCCPLETQSTLLSLTVTRVNYDRGAALSVNVFVSYAMSDQTIAAEVVRLLQATGIEAVTLQDVLKVGENWADRLRKDLVQSDAVVTVLSHEGGDNAALMNALGAASSMHKPLILIHVDAAPMPITLRDAHVVEAAGLSPAEIASAVTAQLQAP